MRSLPRTLTALGCLWLGATMAAPALAQADVDRATARTLGEEGAKALDAKDYKTAEADFRRADSIIHAPTLLLGLARALAGEGKLVEAQEAYRRIVREGVAPGSPPAFQKAVDDATREVQGVSSQVGAVTISVKGPAGESIASAQVTWDQTPVNAATLGVKRPADPGSHALHVAADGYLPADLKVEVPVGGSVDAPVTLAKDTSAAAVPQSPAPSAPPASTAPAPAPAPDQPPASSGGFGVWPWVAFGVGGAGLAVGTITGVLAISKRSSTISNCSSSGVCPTSQQSNFDSYNTLGLVSTVGFIVGGVGAAAGVTLLLLHPKADAAAPSTGLHVVPVLGPGSVGAVGTF